MKYITKGMYIHRGKGINYWPELGGWMVDNDLRVYKTLVDAKNAVDKYHDGSHKAEPKILGEAEYDHGKWKLKVVK